MKFKFQFYIYWALFTSCETRQVNCDFEFQINVETYQYDSRTGRLRKLIDPFTDDALQVYADTILFLTEEKICQLEELCRVGSLVDFPDSLTQTNKNEAFLGRNYKFSFSNGQLFKTIVWEDSFPSTTEENILRNIVSTIDSLITNSKEFKTLPETNFVLE